MTTEIYQPADTVCHIAATVPTGPPPAWAVLQRTLFEVLDQAWRVFEHRYCKPDGSLAYTGRLADRDGADDFYEPFFNWPALYLLGGSDDLLPAVKQHWEGVTRQLMSQGLLVEEYERGYDWFHQGESLLFFYGVCAADPQDEVFRRRAQRFASLYLDDAPTGNYDAERNLIRAPHNGAGGPRYGLGDEFDSFRADRADLMPYGLPLHDIEGITCWEDLTDPTKARAMGQAMQERLGRGDTAINLGCTSLLANAWLYDNDPRYADWITRYVGGWLSRSSELGDVMPDNVGPSGRVGEDHAGRWYGGHYGWTWPHGYHSVGAAALIGAMNAAFVSGDPALLELARVPLRQILAHERLGTVSGTPSSQTSAWTQRLGEAADEPVALVPMRHGLTGWFDYQPLQLAFPTWLWFSSMDTADAEMLRSLRTRSGYDWAVVRPFRDKEEAGHEAPWLAYLAGDNPEYPVEATRLALAQVAHRLALIEADDSETVEDIHWWQRLNPVVTEVLTQLTTGAPQVLYNGGLQHARLRYGDADAGRPGLPPDVAALVEHLDERSARLRLVNLSPTRHRMVWVCAGAFGEHRIDGVRYDQSVGAFPGDSRSAALSTPAASSARVSAGGSRLLVSLPPNRSARLELELTLRAYTPRHQVFTTVHHRVSQEPAI